jgi:predicted AAA+ superfamily ATPase
MEITLVERPRYLDRVWPFVNTDVIKVFVGLRRSGKSQLLELIRRRLVAEGTPPDHIISLNFEDFGLSQLRDPEVLHAYLVERIDQIDGKAYVFLDEIQEVPGFEKVVNSLRSVHNADVYITGSNSKLLSGELATHLAGRYVQFEVYPFGFEEFQRARAAIGEDSSFDAFLRDGGMPYLATHSQDAESARLYSLDIYRSVVLKDIVERHGIRDIALFERILAFALQNTGSLLSANAISAFVKNEKLEARPQTVLNYLGYCTDAFLLERMPRYDLVGKKRLKTLEKYYVADIALRNALIGDGNSQIQGLLENVVAMEALRRGYTVGVGVAGQKEIDFVLDRGGNRRYIQVTYLMADQSTVDREFGVLESIRDNFPKTVVSMDPVLRPRNGIEHRHINEFLLATDW